MVGACVVILSLTLSNLVGLIFVMLSEVGDHGQDFPGFLRCLGQKVNVMLDQYKKIRGIYVVGLHRATSSKMPNIVCNKIGTSSSIH